MHIMSRVPVGWESRPCLGTPIELWFGPEETSPCGPRVESVEEQTWRERRALAICAGCPFVDYCLADELSLSISHQWGVRGGMTAAQRQGLLRARRDQAAADATTGEVA